MDKQKQIEEMANCKSCYERFGHCYLKNRKDCSDWKKAVSQYEQGYRKIPEGAVVILDEETEEFAEKLAKSPQMQKVMSHLIKEWRKETAEKFAEMAKNFVDQYKSPVGGNDFVLNAERLILGIDEILKEIIREQ